jgi:hypothetical protein
MRMSLCHDIELLMGHCVHITGAWACVDVALGAMRREMTMSLPGSHDACNACNGLSHWRYVTALVIRRWRIIYETVMQQG